MNKNIVIESKQYDHIDGRNAYKSNVKRLTLGKPALQKNKNMQIAAQIWEEGLNGELEVSVELPIHQVIDLMIFLSRTLVHFREAYRLPLLYNPEKQELDRIGVQGGVMSVAVCTENPNVNEEIKSFSQSLNDLGELTGERLRILSRILEEMR